MSRVGLGTPPPAAPAVQVGVPEAGPATIRDPARIPRRLGLTGALMMGIGALGAGALPVPNPLFGLRVISLPARNATAAIAITYAGMGMLVLAWLWIGQMLRARGAVAPAPDRTQLARTGLLWALPLALAPPMFSKDVYSYLAQSAITARGLDPYSLGPAAALGVDDPLTRTIPTIWRDTPAPYGPLFLMLGRGITALTGSDVIQGVYAHRILALCGVALIIWALPRLARRCDLDAGLVLWLGAVNPLVLFHLVSGIHNEGLMIGLMLAGVELVLRALDRGSTAPSSTAFLRDPRFVLGVVVVSLGAAVKLPALLALGFVGMAAARLRGGRIRDVAVVAAVSGAIAAAVFVVLGVGTGLGFGWTRTLGTANVIRSWMSLATDLGQLSGQLGILAGLGDHTDTVLTITRGLGGLLAALLCLRLLLLVLRGRLDPVTGLGVGLGAVVLLGPVVHPWYLLWAAIPLAATRGMPRHRRAALAASALLAVMLPPTGSDFAFRSFQLPLAILAGILILAVALLVVRRELRASGSPVLDDVEPATVGGVPLVDPSVPAPTGEPAPLTRPDVASPPSPTGSRAPT
ncbi:MAG TPA: polyprenol phosphomannose-dependent alpha 1,6 mannosyltransferase MptB [Pseudonocardia sp.]|nr:polyprenol phosphomannose-dependent alpha 1,6 mannosyltransferase MptB [Pseudonocardia sp.]